MSYSEGKKIIGKLSWFLESDRGIVPHDWNIHAPSSLSRRDSNKLQAAQSKAQRLLSESISNPADRDAVWVALNSGALDVLAADNPTISREISQFFGENPDSQDDVTKLRIELLCGMPIGLMSLHDDTEGDEIRETYDTAVSCLNEAMQAYNESLSNPPEGKEEVSPTVKTKKSA